MALTPLPGSLECPVRPRTRTRRFSLPLCARIGCMPDGSPTTQSRGLQPGFVEILDQPLRAVAADLLVVADEQMQRTGELARLDVGHGGEAGGDEALHVGRRRGIQPAVGPAQRERIGTPGLAIDRNGIDMTGQRDATRAVWADDGVDVGLLTGCIGADAIRNSMRVEIVADELDQREIGIAAGGVERHQPGEQVNRAEPRRGGGCIHAAAVYTDCRGWPTDGVSSVGRDIGKFGRAGD